MGVCQDLSLEVLVPQVAAVKFAATIVRHGVIRIQFQPMPVAAPSQGLAKSFPTVLALGGSLHRHEQDLRCVSEIDTQSEIPTSSDN